MRNFTETLGQVLHCATAVLLVVRLNFAIMKVMWWTNSLQMSPLMICFKNYADKSSNSLETKSLASLRHGKKADIRVYVGEKLNSREQTTYKSAATCCRCSSTGLQAVDILIIGSVTAKGCGYFMRNNC